MRWLRRRSVGAMARRMRRGAFVRLGGACAEHGASVLVDQRHVEPVLRILDDDVLRQLGNVRHVLQSLPERGRREREAAVLGCLAHLVGGGRIDWPGMVGGLVGRHVLGVLQVRAHRNAVDLDDAGIAALLGGPEGVPHRAGHELQLLLVLGRIGGHHDEEAHQERHQIREGDEPSVAAMGSLFLAGHWGCALRPPLLRTRPGDAPADRRRASP